MAARSLSYTREQLRALQALRPVLGARAAVIYEAHGRSLHKVVGFARDSSRPGCRRLVTGLALAQALLAEQLRSRCVFTSPAAVKDYLKLHFAGQAHESFGVMFLDTQHALLAFEDLFRGTLEKTSVYPREILKRALHYNAVAVILAHPSGSTQPSRADEVLTQALRS